MAAHEADVGPAHPWIEGQPFDQGEVKAWGRKSGAGDGDEVGNGDGIDSAGLQRPRRGLEREWPGGGLVVVHSSLSGWAIARIEHGWTSEIEPVHQRDMARLDS